MRPEAKVTKVRASRSCGKRTSAARQRTQERKLARARKQGR